MGRRRTRGPHDAVVVLLGQLCTVNRIVATFTHPRARWRDSSSECMRLRPEGCDISDRAGSQSRIRQHRAYARHQSVGFRERSFAPQSGGPHVIIGENPYGLCMLRAIHCELIVQFSAAHNVGFWSRLCNISRIAPDQCNELANDVASLPLCMGGLGLRSGTACVFGSGT